MDLSLLGGGYGGGPSMGTIGQRPALPGLQSPPMPSQGPSGVTRRGSQMVDAQGNVIGHYDDNGQPVYHGGLGGGLPPTSEGPGGFGGHNQDPGPRWGGMIPQGPVASTSMGMDPRYVRMQMPGGVQDVPSAYAPTYLQQGGSLTGESTQYPAYNMSNLGRSEYRVLMWITHRFAWPNGHWIYTSLRFTAPPDEGFKWAIWHVCCRTGWTSAWND